MALSRIPQSSYYDQHNRPTKALYRARQPYLIKNALTGLCIMGFAVGVYAFTIRAVAQDDFEDVKVPDAPVQPALSPAMSTVKQAGSK